MNDLGNALWVLWLCYWVSGALVGSFLGTMLAWGVRSLYRKVKKWMDE